jgi:hypothetical protein
MGQDRGGEFCISLHVSPERPPLCIWCGECIDTTEDGASFLFLAKDASGGFITVPERWKDNSPHIEGHQFFCHVRCFRATVPDAQQPWLELELDEP